MPLPGLRRPTYNGADAGTEQFSRGVNDSIRFLQSLPTTQGILIDSLDFKGSPNFTAAIKHTMGRKAKGVSLLSVKSKDPANTGVPSGIPVHVSFKDTDNIAYVRVTEDMANNYLWSLWVW